MNTKFNTIETIQNDTTIINKIQAYLNACDTFESQASEFAVNDNVVSRNSSLEVSLAYARAKECDCEYSIYREALACEMWLSKAWNNAD